MPELPEMETYRRLLTPRLAGRPIEQVVITREKSINTDVPAFTDAVRGQMVRAIHRRAKHLVFSLGDGEQVLVLHLMLGGSMFYGAPEEKPDRTVQVELSFGREKLHFIGLRLGYLHLHSAEEAERLFAKLGPEPLDPGFGEEPFRQLFRKKRGALKTALVDQSFIAGIGNCYSDEICFEAGILPDRRIEGLEPEELLQLFRAMRSVLTEAVSWGGYMDMPLFAGDTVTGGFDPRCRVYDREGEPCFRCGTPILRHDFASRKSFCCRVCQR